LDVARFGDDRTALAKRASNHLLEPIKWWRGKDNMQVCGLIVDEYNKCKVKPHSIFIDSIGNGSGVCDRLAELGLPVTGINVAETPSFGDRFLRLRDELWWNGREWFRQMNVKIPDDGGLIAELTLPTYTMSSGGKIKVESKDEVKKRTAKTASSMGKSPDLADAFLLTLCHGSLVTRKNKKLVYPSLGII
jgi:hypothetical protein